MDRRLMGGSADDNPEELGGDALSAWYRRRSDVSGQEDAALGLALYADETRRELGRAPGRNDVQAQLIEIGNPANPGLIREWEKANGEAWPRDPNTGRPFDVGHIKALADGGENTLENIRPIHPEMHRMEHKTGGDFSRWAKRAGIARAFGGRVARALGPLSILPIITGAMSGRIRTDSFDNFSSDVIGMPSQEDRRRFHEMHQRWLNPKWKPGDPEMV